MTSRLRPIGHEDKMSIVEHLDELRTRLIICVATFLAMFAVCFWQNDNLLDIMNRPVEQTAFKSGGTKDPLEQSAIFQQLTADALGKAARYFQAQAGDPDADRADRDLARQAADAMATAAKAAPAKAARRPVTLGVGEPFFATFRVAAYAAFLLALPVILWQLYAFVLPAFSPQERKVAVPLMAMIPFLFGGGVAFAYFVVLPNAIDFLQNFNDEEFDILIQAKDLYRFSVMVCIALGLLFQIPIAILLLTRTGMVTVGQLRANRRYAILIIAVLAMFLPGTDPVTMLLAMAPLLLLYEGSILLAAFLDRRVGSAEDRSDSDED